MKKLIIISLILIASQAVFGQQDPQYSLYMFNPLGVNPGYAGSREVLSGVLIHRSQWVGLDGAPETQVLSLNTPLKNKKMGLGLQIVNDKIGPRNTQQLSLSYAYRLKLGGGKLAFGLRAGMLNYNYDWDKIEYKDAEDQIPTTGSENVMLPTFDFGMYYNTKTFYLGAAVDHLNQAKFNLSSSDSLTSEAKKHSNFTATVGKAFVLNNNLVLKTSALLRASNATGNIDVNASILIKNKILFGLTARSTEAFVLITEFNITKNFRLGAGYDFDMTDVAKSTSGSFEIFVGYDIGLFKSKMESPRYF